MSDKPIKILLVEDNLEYAHLIRAMVSGVGGTGFELAHVERLSEALKYISEQSWDVVLLDLSLPDSHGLDTVVKVQAHAPNVPIVVLTGLDDEALAIKAMQEGAQDYLVKGQVNGNLLRRSIRYAIERKRGEEVFKTLAISSPIGIYVVQDRVFQFISPQFQKLVGYSETELLGMDSLRIVHPEDREMVRENAIRMLKGGHASPYEYRYISKSGQTKWVLETVASIQYRGRRAAMGNFLDITERKRAEEERRELDRMKSEFIANVSHELRTPLHSIRGFTRLMLQKKVPEPKVQKEFLTIIDNQSENLEELINNLLDASRLESGRFKVQKHRLSIKDLINEVVEGFYTIASEKGITINTNVPQSLPEVEVDGKRLKQVLNNLLSNAVKFSNGGTSVTVRSETKDGELMVQVSDQGIGIPEEVRQHLFERFYRAKDTARVGGTGLGLYISKQIIEAHGGHIWVESKVGEGSTFSFTLPLIQTSGDANE